VVSYTRRPPGPLGGFYERARRRAFGAFVTREDIERRNPFQTTDLLRTMAGIQLTPARFGNRYHVRMRGCAPRVFLDGIQIRMVGLTIDDLVRPNELEGIEVYRSSAETPGEFTSPGGCGAIALWTRRGG
jgi:outer membrane receptor for ferrienterochelin and colicin